MIPFPAMTCALKSQQDKRVRARQYEKAGWGGNEKLEILLPCNPGSEFLNPCPEIPGGKRRCLVKQSPEAGG